jgi:Lrp/AsnC family transcriptional regulator, leucine-responsive regulatory protein
MHQIDLDSFDIAILNQLQANARLASVAMAEAVHLSASQITRRLKRLEETGVIRRYAALLEPAALGLGLMAFTNVSLDVQTKETAREFHHAMQKLPAVLECYSTTGDADFLLKIIARDLAAFSDLLMNDIMPLAHVRNVRSSIVLNELKSTTVLELERVVVR